MGSAPRWSSSLKALGVRLTAPPMVAGIGRISKILMVGIWPAGANFVKARAEVKPAIPPPKIMISSPFVGAAEAIAAEVTEGACGKVLAIGKCVEWKIMVPDVSDSRKNGRSTFIKWKVRRKSLRDHQRS